MPDTVVYADNQPRRHHRSLAMGFVSFFLWGISLACLITGTVLLWDARETTREALNSTGSILDNDSARYGICIFVFTWVLCLLASITKHNMLLAASSGLLVALLVRVITIGEMDDLRILRKEGSFRDTLGLTKSEVDRTLGGAVLAYIGVALAFLLQTEGQAKIADAGAFIKGLVSFIVVTALVVIGAIVLWSSDVVGVNAVTDFGATLRVRAFMITNVGIAVGFVAATGFLFRVYAIVAAAVTLAAAFGITLLMDLFEVDNLISGSNTDQSDHFRTGAGMIWIGMVATIFLGILCAFRAGKENVVVV
eukprot:m.211145 g.211145  ORF g.211145 m.211145 type:complete len:308 (-) comp17870_c0_seq1:282-1205(-)